MGDDDEMSDDDPAYLKNLKAYCKVGNHDIKKVFDALESESIRSFIVISGSLVEDDLTELLKASMRQGMNGDEEKQLWGIDGIIGTFSAKIKMAYATSLIDKKTCKKLNHLRTIRNQCAHAMMPFDLDVEVVVDACLGFIAPRLAELTTKRRKQKKALTPNQKEQIRLHFSLDLLDLLELLSAATHTKKQSNLLLAALSSTGKQPQPSKKTGPP